MSVVKEKCNTSPRTSTLNVEQEQIEKETSDECLRQLSRLASHRCVSLTMANNVSSLNSTAPSDILWIRNAAAHCMRMGELDRAKGKGDSTLVRRLGNAQSTDSHNGRRRRLDKISKTLYSSPSIAPVSLSRGAFFIFLRAPQENAISPWTKLSDAYSCNEKRLNKRMMRNSHRTMDETCRLGCGKRAFMSSKLQWATNFY